MLAAPGALRDKLLICLLGLGGIRVEEAVTLRRGQMHLMESSRELGCPVPGPHLHVRGKGDRMRWVPANPYLVAVYGAHMVERSAIAAADRSDFVLVNLWGGEIGAAMTTGRARRVVARLARRAHIARHVTPHQFRHGLATQLVERGRPLDEVQRILGHAQYETTRRYVTTTPARLREAIESVPLPGAVPVTVVQLRPAVDVDDRLERARRALDLAALVARGWDAERHVFAPSPDDPLFGWAPCERSGCGRGARGPAAGGSACVSSALSTIARVIKASSRSPSTSASR